MRERVPADFFERLYAADEDPWHFADSPYEAAKYDATIAALEGRTFPRGLELGCSIGVLSARLAERCESLLAVDASAAAVQRARARLAGRTHVEVEQRTIPEQFPQGVFDLVVCSEILYYLDPPAFAAALDAIDAALAPGGSLLAVHWRPQTVTYPLRGDEVHALLAERFGRSALGAPTESYALDRWDRA